MGDLLQTGSAWLEDQRVKYCSHKVDYARGSVTVEVNATTGRTLFVVDDGYGAQIRIESRDYLILATELILDSTQTLPQVGDQVREAADSQTLIYEVVSPGGEPHYRFSDPYRKTLRIHTKLIGQESAP